MIYGDRRERRSPPPVHRRRHLVHQPRQLDRGDGNPVVVELGAGGAALRPPWRWPSGQVVIGDAADAVIAAHPERGVRELKRRFGDTTPVVLDGQPYTADALTAEVLRSVAAHRRRRPRRHDGGAHPPRRLARVQARTARGHRRRAGFAEVEVISEAEAAVRPYVRSGRLQRGSTVAVYDLGGTFEVSLVALTDDGSASARHTADARAPGRRRARPGGVPPRRRGARRHAAAAGSQRPRRAGCHRHPARRVHRREGTTVQRRRDLHPRGGARPRHASADDPRRVRDRGAAARERDPDGARPALASAGLQAADLTAVVLVGGGSQVPVVAEMVAGHLGRPALVDDPRTAVVLGAVVPAVSCCAAARPRCRSARLRPRCRCCISHLHQLRPPPPHQGRTP